MSANYFIKAVEELKKENRYRKFVNLSRICDEFPYAINEKNGKKITIWCSNDYLGLGQNKVAIKYASEALIKYGIGAGGTRNISGTSKILTELESEIANLHQKEAALTFTSGYIANDATLQTLAKIIPNLVVFSDQKNHASIIAGIKNSKLEKNIFRHNDLNHLEELLKNYPKEKPKLIVIESVYSMDGDFGKIVEIAHLAKKYNCLTYVDEVHGVGLYGRTGAGLCQELNISQEIDIIQGTLAKAFATIGGYITGKVEIIDAIRSIASGFIFTTALPPAIAAASITNIKHVKENNLERLQLHRNVALLKEKLEKASIAFVGNSSHIISIKIGSAKKAQEISQKLLEQHNIYVQHINYPTVNKGDERLRITITPVHTEEMMEDLVVALKHYLHESNI